jgi:hypothetical protein
MSSIRRRRRPGETQRGAHDVDLATTSIQGEEKAWGSCEASEVSPMPRRRCRRSGRGVEERRGDERERAGRRRSPGISGGATLASAGGAASSLSDAASRGGGMKNRRMWAMAAASRIGGRRRRFRFWVVERMRWHGGWGHSGKTWSHRTLGATGRTRAEGAYLRDWRKKADEFLVLLSFFLGVVKK